ncbi:hypothetical protein HanHA300_Chr17g0671441 [Helianthus annuus]|nr:hypothetical protein HanHA300_Chr17g0671441 [Helianthus annuus]KAJ0435585.1 hypothetical protein HanIR_Chr17g0894931 [Helianthus annuus]KAJ0633965.1 hypothetical protein HanLR1_Chr17g0682771 [Helianthus annuus]
MVWCRYMSQGGYGTDEDDKTLVIWSVGRDLGAVCADLETGSQHRSSRFGASRDEDPGLLHMDED